MSQTTSEPTRRERKLSGVGSGDPLPMPFTVTIDQRELNGGLQWCFTNLHGLSKDKYRPLIVPTVVKTIETGDYSIHGLEHLITIERKSLSDLYSTLAGGDRTDRFEAEHQRMAEMRRRCVEDTAGAIVQSTWVVIEASWPDILAKRGIESRLHPSSVMGRAIAWQGRYGVLWHAAGSRRAAEIWAFWMLRNFYETRVKIMERKAADAAAAAVVDSI